MLKKIMPIFLLLFIASPVFAVGSDISVKAENGVYIFKIPIKKYQDKIKPYVAENLTTAAELFQSGKYKLVVNGGFFDPVNLPVSNVIIDGKTVQSLFQNPDLIAGLEKQGRTEKVLNRSEFRILNDTKGRLSFDITEHFAAPRNNSSVKHSLQAGPMLIPNFRIEEECFVRYSDNKIIGLAADVLKRRERTILGLKQNLVSGGELYIIIFTGENKAALNEVRDFCSKLGLNKALALDGGASTSINYENIEIFSASNSQRKVKSFLVIEN